MYWRMVVRNISYNQSMSALVARRKERSFILAILPTLALLAFLRRFRRLSLVRSLLSFFGSQRSGQAALPAQLFFYGTDHGASDILAGDLFDLFDAWRGGDLQQQRSPSRANDIDTRHLEAEHLGGTGGQTLFFGRHFHCGRRDAAVRVVAIVSCHGLALHGRDHLAI